MLFGAYLSFFGAPSMHGRQLGGESPLWGGEGTPGVKPLSFVSCTLEDGSKIDNQQGITLQPKFTLTFHKNVVNMLIWERNRKCFSISTDDNGQVPIKNKILI